MQLKTLVNLTTTVNHTDDCIRELRPAFIIPKFSMKYNAFLFIQELHVARQAHVNLIIANIRYPGPGVELQPIITYTSFSPLGFIFFKETDAGIAKFIEFNLK